MPAAACLACKFPRELPGDDAPIDTRFWCDACGAYNCLGQRVIVSHDASAPAHPRLIVRKLHVDPTRNQELSVDASRPMFITAVAQRVLTCVLTGETSTVRGPAAGERVTVSAHDVEQDRRMLQIRHLRADGSKKQEIDFDARDPSFITAIARSILNAVSP